MSDQAWSVVTLSLNAMRWSANTHSARTWPARHWAMFSLGLLTFESVCLPTSWVAAWPPLLYGM